jgi:hypothetical protein
MKITIDGHSKGSIRSHRRGKEYSKENSTKRMSQEKLDRGLDELKIQLSCIG